MKRSVARFAMLAGAALIASAAGAQSTTAPPAPVRSSFSSDSALEARTTAVARTLRCPVCQGESIQDSPSELAQQMRAVVRERLRAGESPEEIKAYFASRYGEWILLEPRMTGLNILLYILPVVLVLGGLALVVMLVRRWTKAAAEVEPGTDQPETTDASIK
ncbi:MAG: cytochrome c-type biogenesis protein [Gemmatimonadaceae bacterium]